MSAHLNIEKCSMQGQSATSRQSILFLCSVWYIAYVTLISRYVLGEPAIAQVGSHSAMSSSTPPHS